MPEISVEVAQASLGELIASLNPGDEIILTKDQVPVAKIVATNPSTTPPRAPRLGTQPGSVLYMSSDFDAPIDAK